MRKIYCALIFINLHMCCFTCVKYKFMLHPQQILTRPDQWESLKVMCNSPSWKFFQVGSFGSCIVSLLPNRWKRTITKKEWWEMCPDLCPGLPCPDLVSSSCWLEYFCPNMSNLDIYIDHNVIIWRHVTASWYLGGHFHLLPHDHGRFENRSFLRSYFTVTARELTYKARETIYV